MNHIGYYHEGKKQYQAKNYLIAIDLLKKSIAQNEQYEPCYFELGKCYEKLDYHTEAIAFYKKGLMLCDNEEYISDYHLNIGKCYIMLSELEKALYHFNESDKSDKNKLFCKYNKALVYLCKKEYAKSLVLYETVLKEGLVSDKLNHYIEYCVKKIHR